MTNPRTNDNSGTLFDDLLKRFKLRNDAELAAHIETTKSYISEVRNGHREIGDSLLVRICEKSGLSLKTAKSKIAERTP